MSDDPQDLSEVQQRLREIQTRNRGRIRWSVGKHTAEMAIGAIEKSAKTPSQPGKPRRRKRRKRLL